MTIHPQSSFRDSISGMRPETDLSQSNKAFEARLFVKHIFATAVSSRRNIPIVEVLDSMHVEPLKKAAVAPMSSSNTSSLNSYGRAFADVMLRQTVLGRLSGTLSAPPNTPIPTPQTDPEGAWVIEGRPIPCGSIDFTAPRTAISKYAFILAFSDELTRIVDDRGLNVVERVALRATRHNEDALLLSDTAAVDQGNPAGLLFGLFAVGEGSPSTLTDDFSALWTSVADGDPSRPHFVMSPRGAMFLASLREEGSPRFPDISLSTGGSIFGVPVLLSQAAGNRVVLFDAEKIAVTDEGLEVTPSRQTSIQMVNTPTPGAASVVSMFQTGSTALRFIRYVHWTKLSDDAAAFLTLPIGGSPA
jgi:HK97 family phage major capsid protein